MAMIDPGLIKQIVELERRIRPHGVHAALTGSVLYGDAGGGGTGKDIDLVVYTHDNRPSVTVRQRMAVRVAVCDVFGVYVSGYAHYPEKPVPRGYACRVDVFLPTDDGRRRVDVLYPGADDYRYPPIEPKETV